MDIDPVRDEEMIKRRHRIRGVLLTMLGAFCFALAPVWVRSIEAYGSTSIVFYRALIGSIPLVIWVLRSPRLRQGADLRQMNAKQGLVLLIAGVIGMFIGVIPIIGWLLAPFITLAWLILAVLGIVNVVGNKEKELPILGQYADKLNL